MKIMRTLVASGLLASIMIPLMSLSAAFAEDGICLVENGNPKARIYVSADEAAAGDSGLLSAALDDLALHIERMSGARLSVLRVKSTKDVETPAIVIGRLACEMGAEPPKNEEGYRILTKNGAVLIGASTGDGASYGIYTLLEHLGCDWVMPGEIGMITPEKNTINVREIDESGAPAFAYRLIWYRGGSEVPEEDRRHFEEWCRRQKLHLLSSGKHNEMGGGHYWDALIRSHQRIFDENPDMLALVRKEDGTMTRKGPQIEPTHPKVAELIAEDIREKFRKNNWPKEHELRHPIGPADGEGFSQSVEALALSGISRQDVILGGKDATDQVIHLANEVIRLLGDEYSNVTLTYYCYSVHQEYPARQKPHPRINVVFAPISFSRLHATGDPASKTRTYYRHILDQWAKLHEAQGNTLGFYEYNWNLAENMLPFTRLHMVGEDIPMYHRMGCEWAVIEATRAWSINGPHDYVSAKLLWDADKDWRVLFREYCDKAFGPAAPMLERYYLRLAGVQSKAGQEAGSYHAAALIFSKDYITAAKRDFEEALEQKLTRAQRTRVEYAMHPLHTLELYLEWFHALNAFKFPQAQVAYDQMLAHWQEALEKNSDLVGYEIPGYMRSFLGKTTEQALRYSTAPYVMMTKLDDALPTALDPTGSGELLNLHSPQINDSDWIRTKTYSSNWDAQGLGFYRTGDVWYRFHFAVPKDIPNKGVGLFLGGFEDEARVWCNGTFVGASRKFSEPAVFDLTDAITPGESNLLAIQVKRNTHMNENLLGGIFRPSFIFSGPRPILEDSGNERKESRILPGGEREEIAR